MKKKRKFIIPEIPEDEYVINFGKNKFISPIFGRKNVKDENVIIGEAPNTGDIRKRYDAFRTNKKLTDDEAKEMYGTKYYEFDLIRKQNREKIEAQQFRKEINIDQEYNNPNIHNQEEVFGSYEQNQNPFQESYNNDNDAFKKKPYNNNQEVPYVENDYY